MVESEKKYKKLWNGIWEGKTLKAVFRQHVLLSLFVLLLIRIPLPSGSIFGSEGDWISQHVAVAESLRQAMREGKTLIPQWIGLGGGSSVYDFSYYGLLRPDVILSCFLPGIEMRYIISLYAAVGVAVAVNLTFVWLKRQGLSPGFALAGTVLFACATCFYQAHHQIMFVNYMPFLLSALMAVDKLLEKRRMYPLIVSLFLICVHSYYYAPTCFLVVCLYFWYQKSRRKIKKQERENTIYTVAGFVASVMLSVGLAAMLLLPTALDILSAKKDGGQFAEKSLSLIDWNLEGLLYTPYGCGLTVLTLYCLLLAIKPLPAYIRLSCANARVGEKGNNYTLEQSGGLQMARAVFASVLLAVVLFPAVSLALNAFLYARAKILIPFLPLFVLVAADVMERLCFRRMQYSYVPLALCLFTAVGSKWWPLVLVECAVLALWIYIQRKGKCKGAGYFLVFLVPAVLNIGVNMTETYINMDAPQQEYANTTLLQSKNGNPLYRYNITVDSLRNCNLAIVKNETRTTMYSSVTNGDYAAFYYDRMKNPIYIQNRVALLAGENRFFQYFMGERYLLAAKEDIPAGYRLLEERDGYALVENPQVLPVCYGTNELLGRSDYDKLQYPENLEAICARTIIEDDADVTLKNTAGDCANQFLSHMVHQETDSFFRKGDVQKLLSGKEEEQDFILQLSKTLENHVILLSFDVESDVGDEVVVTINGIKNKLSSRHAPYPNRNNTFTYIITENEPISRLFVYCSKGNYQIRNIHVATMDLQYVGHRQVFEPELKEGSLQESEKNFCSTEIIAGEIDMKEPGCFVTSYPYRLGYYAVVDGKRTVMQRVNTAFLGFPLEEGVHEFAIYYETPGYRAGVALTAISSLLLIGMAVVHLGKRVNRKSGRFSF